MSVSVAVPEPRAATPLAQRFHPLRVKRVIRETADARSIVFDVPEDLAVATAYEAGQFMTLRVVIDGQAYLRSYSMSSAPTVDDELQVTVKRVPGGVVSSWLVERLAEGDVIEVTSPAGEFVLGDVHREIVAFAGGSGITPVFSIVKTALGCTSRRVRLLYANRDRASVIFATELATLAERFGERLVVAHHLDLEHGVIDAREVATFVQGAVDADFYICGPQPFMDAIEQALVFHGATVDQIHIERFTPPEPPMHDEPASPDTVADAEITIQLAGRKVTVRHRPGSSILLSARAAGLRPPSSCEAGTCGTCMARVIEGRVEMHRNDALSPGEVAAGWVLTCQAVPVSPSVRVVYE